MNKLKKTLNHRASDKFVNNLEAQLMEKFEKKHSPLFFLRFSAAGVSLVLLLALGFFFFKPLAIQDNLVARALEVYESLEAQPGVYHVKYNVTAYSAMAGEPSEGAINYVYEEWIGDNGEHLNVMDDDSVSPGTQRVVTELRDIDGRTFSDNRLGIQVESEPFSLCLIDNFQVDSFLGRNTLQISGASEPVYTPNLFVMEDFSGDLEMSWYESKVMLPNDILVAMADERFAVKVIELEEKEVFEIIVEGEEGHSMEEGAKAKYYFDKESLLLEKVVYSSNDSGFDYVVDYDHLVMENIAASEDLFSAERLGLTEVYRFAPHMFKSDSELGCYDGHGRKLSEETETELMKNLPTEKRENVKKFSMMLKQREVDIKNCANDRECIIESGRHLQEEYLNQSF